MHRRALLAGAGLAGSTALAGCAGLRRLLGEEVETGPGSGTGAGTEGPSTGATATGTGTGTGTPLSGPPVSQSVSVGNTNRGSEYVTVAVGRGSETAFVASVELLPGERVSYEDAVTVGGEYEVVVETSSGARRRQEWTVDDRLDGLAVHVDDGVTVWPTLRCRRPADCALSRGGTAADLPLVGDGSARWYAPAGVRLLNPERRERTVGLRVDLDEASLVDADFALPGRTRLTLPLTYRSGSYEVRVAVGDETARSTWLVPQVPRRTVTLGESVRFGCGPANTVARVRNADDVAHRVALAVRSRDGERRHAERRLALGPGESTELEPVSAAGAYRLTARTDAGSEATETWWACPPHGPVDVVVDATGTVRLSQGFDGGRV